MRVWLDDERPAPDYHDVLPQMPGKRVSQLCKWDAICRTAEAAIELVRSGKITFISFDHDLGPGQSGYDVACEIERLAARGIKPPDWKIHTANPVGRAAIKMAMENANKMYERYHRSEFNGWGE